MNIQQAEDCLDEERKEHESTKQALASALAEVEKLKAEKSDLIYVLKECVNYLKGEHPSSPQLLSYCQRLLDREKKQ